MDTLFHFIDQEQSKNKESMVSLKILNQYSLNMVVPPIVPIRIWLYKWKEI